MWRFAALWVCRIGPATHTVSHNRRGRAKSPFLTHTHTHSFFNPTPSPTLFDPPPFVLPFPRLLPVAAPCSPSLLNKERFRGEGVKGARGNSYACVCKVGNGWCMNCRPQHVDRRFSHLFVLQDVLYVSQVWSWSSGVWVCHTNCP